MRQKLARPEATVVNLMGEAAFGMVGIDFETAVRCDLPILTVVLRNQVLGGYAASMPVAISSRSTWTLCVFPSSGFENEMKRRP